MVLICVILHIMKRLIKHMMEITSLRLHRDTRNTFFFFLTNWKGYFWECKEALLRITLEQQAFSEMSRPPIIILLRKMPVSGVYELHGSICKGPTCQCRRHKRHGFHPWVRKIPWRSAWQPTPIVLPGVSQG